MRDQDSTNLESEKALYRTLQDEGLLPPETLEDIEALEEEFGTYPPVTDDLANLVKESIERGEPKRLDGHSSNSMDKVAFEGMAAAARNGEPIPEEIRKRMDEDRNRCEQANSEDDDK